MKVLLGISAAIGLGALAVWMFVLRPAHRTPETRATAALIRDARNAGQEKRLAAVQALGEMRSEAAVDELVRLLPDTRPEIRMALIAALGRIGSPKAAVPLEALLEEDEWQVRRAAVEAIGEIRAEVSVPALGRALEDAHPAVALAAAGALSRMGSPAFEVLQAAVEGPAALQRRAALAARLAQAKPAPGARPKAKPDTEDRTGAGAKAGLDARQVDEWIGAHNRVNQAVAYALGRMAHPEAPALLRRMLEDRSPTVRLAAAEALCAKADPRTVQALAPLLKDPDAEVRLGLVRALPRMGDAAVPLFVELASAEERSVRLNAIRFLLASQDPRRLPVLFVAQGEADRNLAHAAKAVIAGLPAAQRVALAAACVRQPKSPARHQAFETLAAAKDPQSAETLAEALRDADPAVRRQAAELLHALGDPRGADAMAAALQDAGADVRFSAARLLATWGDRRGADVLLDFVRNAPRVETKPDGSRDGAIRVSAETQRAADAMRLLGRLGDKRVADLAVSFIQNEVPGLGVAGCETVGSLRDPRGFDLLASRLPRAKFGGEPMVRGLGALGDPRGVGVLVEFLRNVDRNFDASHTNAVGVYRLKHFWMRTAIVAAIEQIGGDEAKAALTGILDQTPSQDIPLLLLLCEAMGRMDDVRLVSPLTRMLTHDCPEPPKAAMAAIRKMGAKAVPALIAELKNPSVARHTAVSTALAELGAPAAEPLLAALQDPDAMIRHGAAWALGQMGEPRAVDPLLARLGDTNTEVRASAAWALGQLKAPCAVDPILQMVGATQSVVRAAAAEALGQLGDRRAVAALETLAQDKDTRVVQSAQQALKQLARRETTARE